MRVPPQQAAKPDAELVVRLTSKRLGVLRAARRLADLAPAKGE